MERILQTLKNLPISNSTKASIINVNKIKFQDLNFEIKYALGSFHL